MGIRANYGTMSDAATDLSNISNQLKERLETLHSQVKRLSENWDGEAKQAFAVQERKLEEAMSGLQNSAHSQGTLVSGASTNLSAADRQGASRFM